MPIKLQTSTQSLRGVCVQVSKVRITSPIQRTPCVILASGRVDELTGSRRNKANSVSFSNRKTRKFQEVNLQSKKVYWDEGQRWVKLRVTARTLKTIEKRGLATMATEAGIDLWKLPYEDARPQRLAYLEANPNKVPTEKNPRNRKMKNPERLAASKKKPMVPQYFDGRIIKMRQGEEVKVFEMMEVQRAADAAAAEAKRNGSLN